MAKYDHKEYARQLRENCVKDAEGVIRCSPELWEQIATIIESSVEVKRGVWIDKWNGKYANPTYVCSNCGEKALLESYINELDQWRHRQSLSICCPHCGAKMDGERKTE